MQKRTANPTSNKSGELLKEVNGLVGVSRGTLKRRAARHGSVVCRTRCDARQGMLHGGKAGCLTLSRSADEVPDGKASFSL